MKLVLIGDVHLFTLRVQLRRLLSRRVMAHSNLLLRRRHHFDHTLLPQVVERARSLRPDRVLFSGDVSTSSLESEFESFRQHFAPLLDAAPATLVPGNHDRYTFGSRRARRIETLLPGLMPERFPHTQPLRSGWTLLALDSATPNCFSSRGGLGARQLREAVTTIEAVEPDAALLVLCHYPCALPAGVPGPWSRSLREAAPLREALAACRGRVVFVHGHIHRPWHVAPGPADGGPPFECLNAGSPCQTGEAWAHGQGFWEIDLPHDPRGELGLRHHALSTPPPAGATAATDTNPPAPATDPATLVWRVGTGP